MDFERRKHYYGLGQILPYLQPGARVLDTHTTGDASVSVLAIRTRTGEPGVFLVNSEEGDVDLTLSLSGQQQGPLTSLMVVRTDSRADADPLGRVRLTNGRTTLVLPARSITTLVPPDVLAGV
jgi:O-glycosyl hydrolase